MRAHSALPPDTTPPPPHMCVCVHVHSRAHTSLWRTHATRLIYLCDMTHSPVWHDSFVCVTWLIPLNDMTHSFVWHESFICVTWLVHLCDMTHSFLLHDSFICVTWFIHMCDMTYSGRTRGSPRFTVTHAHKTRIVWHDSFTHAYVWHDFSLIHSFTHSLIRHTYSLMSEYVIRIHSCILPQLPRV